MAITKRFGQTEDELTFNYLIDFLADLQVITPEQRADRVRGPIIYKPGAWAQKMIDTLVDTKIEDMKAGSALTTLLEAIGDDEDDTL